MNEIKVTTELCKEDRYRLDLIIQLLGQTLTPSTAQDCVADAAEHPVTEPFPAPVAPAPEMPAEKPAPAPEEKPAPAPEEKPAEPAAPAAEPVKKSDVQAAIVRLVAMGKKAEARDIVKSYAASVSAIPEDVLAEVMDKLKTLEGAR